MYVGVDMKHIKINFKTMTSYSDSTLKRTSVTITKDLWLLVCAYFGNGKEARKFIRETAKNGVHDTETINRILLHQVANPELVKIVENDLGLNTDCEEYQVDIEEEIERLEKYHS